MTREKKWDLDDAAHQFCKEQKVADPPKSHPTSEEIKVHKAQALAKFLSDQIEPFASNMSSSSNPDKQEIESLRAQLEAEKTRNALVPRDEVRQCMLALSIPYGKHRRCFC